MSSAFRRCLFQSDLQLKNITSNPTMYMDVYSPYFATQKSAVFCECAKLIGYALGIMTIH